MTFFFFFFDVIMIYSRTGKFKVEVGKVSSPVFFFFLFFFCFFKIFFGVFFLFFIKGIEG
jgi:hypothetical protein